MACMERGAACTRRCSVQRTASETLSISWSSTVRVSHFREDVNHYKGSVFPLSLPHVDTSQQFTFNLYCTAVEHNATMLRMLAASSSLLRTRCEEPDPYREQTPSDSYLHNPAPPTNSGTLHLQSCRRCEGVKAASLLLRRWFGCRRRAAASIEGVEVGRAARTEAAAAAPATGAPLRVTDDNHTISHALSIPV